MRFRKKFGVLGLFNLAIAGVTLAASYYHPRHPHNAIGFAGAMLLVDPLLRFAGWAWVYWDVEPQGLRARRFWKETEVPWSEITRVGPAFPNLKSSSVLAAYYGHPGSAMPPGKLVIDPEPEHEPELLAELQKYAPQAVFERSAGILF